MPPKWGIRDVPITKKKKPVGHVAYCFPCNWSTLTHVTTIEDGDSFHRADIKLVNHLKSTRHKQLNP